MPLTSEDWWGFMLRAIRRGEEFDASAIGWVGTSPVRVDATRMRPKGSRRR